MNFWMPHSKNIEYVYCLVVCNMSFVSIVGLSQAQLTFIFFQAGVSTTNQYHYTIFEDYHLTPSFGNYIQQIAARKSAGAVGQLFNLALRWLHSLLPFLLKKAPKSAKRAKMGKPANVPWVHWLMGDYIWSIVYKKVYEYMGHMMSHVIIYMCKNMNESDGWWWVIEYIIGWWYGDVFMAYCVHMLIIQSLKYRIS